MLAMKRYFHFERRQQAASSANNAARLALTNDGEILRLILAVA